MVVLIKMFLPLSSFEQSVLSFELKNLSSAFWDIYNEVKCISSLFKKNTLYKKSLPPRLMSQRPTVPHSSSISFSLHSHLLISSEMNPTSHW